MRGDFHGRQRDLVARPEIIGRLDADIPTHEDLGCALVATNWETVFKGIFGRREDVRESFQRLYPIRNATMHAGILTLDDELFLRVETRRILKAIGATSR